MIKIVTDRKPSSTFYWKSAMPDKSWSFFTQNKKTSTVQIHSRWN